MNLGKRLFELRKNKRLSQEEVAEKLKVTRQTISKWETNQSTPDFDKIIPLCELYEISSEELLRGEKTVGERTEMKIDFETENNREAMDIEIRKKRALGISFGVLLYIVSVVWIMIAIPVLMLDPIVSSGIFLLICGIATFSVVYTSIVYKKKKGDNETEKTESKIVKQVNEIIALIVLVIYLVISFITMAWYITWIIWVIYGLVEEIVKLIFMLGGKENAK